MIDTHKRPGSADHHAPAEQPTTLRRSRVKTVLSPGSPAGHGTFRRYDMKIIKNPAWIFYLADKEPEFDDAKVGKWMYFFGDRAFVENICKTAIENGIVAECKHSNKDEGVACFYLNDDDLEGHRRLIEFFIENDLIRKTKTGRLYNISFKHDTQTLAGEYGVDYRSDIKLENFVNLETGEWLGA